MQYIDMHCDTLMQAFLRGAEDIYSLPDAMVDVKRLEEGHALAQFFAIFLPPAGAEKMVGRKLPEDDEYIQILSGILSRTMQRNPEKVAGAQNIQDLLKNQREGKISVFLTLEDGRSIDGKLEKIDQYHQLGVRLISLTWNAPNCLGFPNSTDSEQMQRGLTSFGKESVERMNQLGMLVDVSHLSDGGFYDVASISKSPFVASHSNCRELANHPRNLTNDMIHTLGEHGGVAGLNFCPAFLNADATNQDSRTEQMVLHLKHLMKYGGEDCLAIGTDFDGMNGSLEVDNPSKMEKLFEEMKRAGFTERQIEKAAYQNVCRVIETI